jgi:hypothetical protein
MARRLILGAAVCVLAGVLGAPANAAPPARPALPDSFASAHFVVHYDGVPDQADYITQIQAGQLLAFLEQGYTGITSLGYSAPVDDGDGKTDVYVVDLSADKIALSIEPDAFPAPTSASIDIDTTKIGDSAIATSALAGVVELGHWFPINDGWAFWGSAEWLAYKALGYPPAAFSDLAPLDGSLDCSSAAGEQKCATTLYDDDGSSHWPFWESLADRFGATFATSVWDQQRTSGSSMVTALQTVLGTKSATFDDVYHDFGVKMLTHGWGVAGLDSFNVPLAQTITTGIATASLGSNTFSVDHLATKYVAFTRGDGLGDHPCYAASLTLTVTTPAGVNARPIFFWNQAGSTPVALSVNGNTATATLPWDTCLWAANKGILSLTNPSTSVNAARFVVTTSLTVDPNTPAAPTAAPAGQPVYGSVTTVSNADLPPAITLFGPLLLQLSPKSSQLRLIVESTGGGSVHAMLGSVDLGSPAVRAGNNDLRFNLPKSLLSSLRRTSAAGNVLTLTPLSPSGAVAGTAVTRDVAVAAAPKAKPKKKKK